MLNAMRELWEEGTSEAKREAARIAKDASIVQTINEPQQYVVWVPEPCSTIEEWEAEVRAAGCRLDADGS